MGLGPQARAGAPAAHALGVAGDNRLHLSYGHHNTRHRYRRTTSSWLSAPAMSVNLFTANTLLQVPNNAAETLLTYPKYINDAAGNLFFIYRYGASARGDHHLNRYNA